MENPGTLVGEPVREKRAEVLRSLLLPAQTRILRGQYKEYKESEGVEDGSQTETAFSIELALDTERFAGVPFIIESGKRYPEKRTEIEITFRPINECVCTVGNEPHEHKNTLHLVVAPEEGVRLKLWTKAPNVQPVLEEHDLSLAYKNVSDELPNAYEKLLFDAVQGDATLFASEGEVTAAWKFVEQVMSRWEDEPLQEYDHGSRLS